MQLLHGHTRQRRQQLTSFSRQNPCWLLQQLSRWQRRQRSSQPLFPSLLKRSHPRARKRPRRRRRRAAARDLRSELNEFGFQPSLFCTCHPKGVTSQVVLRLTGGSFLSHFYV